MVDRGVLHRFEQAGPLTWLLAACAGWALLLWLAALLGMGGALPSTPVDPAAALPDSPAASPERIGPLAQYAEAAARPVFTSDRRPRSFLATAPDAGLGDAQSQPLDFILTGVLISPQVRLAILQPSGGGESVRVRVGASPDAAPGWRLLDVQPRRAIFAGSSGEASLDLRSFGDAGPPARRGADDGGAAIIGAAVATAQAASDAADAAPVPTSDVARIEAIRQRIEARRAQLRNADQNTRTPGPLGAPPRQ